MMGRMGARAPGRSSDARCRAAPSAGKPRVCQTASARLTFTGTLFSGGLPVSPKGGSPRGPPADTRVALAPGSLPGPVRGQVTMEHYLLPEKCVETLFMCVHACV